MSEVGMTPRTWFSTTNDAAVVIEMINKHSTKEDNLTLVACDNCLCSDNNQFDSEFPEELEQVLLEREYRRLINRINTYLKKQTRNMYGLGTYRIFAQMCFFAPCILVAPQNPCNPFARNGSIEKRMRATSRKLDRLLDKINTEFEKRNKELFLEVYLEELPSGTEVIRLRILFGAIVGKARTRGRSSITTSVGASTIKGKSNTRLSLPNDSDDNEELDDEFPDEEIFTPRDGPGSARHPTNGANPGGYNAEHMASRYNPKQKKTGMGPKGLRHLDVDEMCGLLITHGLSQWTSAFQMHQVDGDIFMDLDEEDLANSTFLGITNEAHRGVLLDWIESGQIPEESSAVPELDIPDLTPRSAAQTGDHLFSARGDQSSSANGGDGDNVDQQDNIPRFFSELTPKPSDKKKGPPEKETDEMKVHVELPKESPRDIFKRAMSLDTNKLAAADKVKRGSAGNGHVSGNTTIRSVLDSDDSDSDFDDGMGTLKARVPMAPPSDEEDDVDDGLVSPVHSARSSRSTGSDSFRPPHVASRNEARERRRSRQLDRDAIADLHDIHRSDEEQEDEYYGGVSLNADDATNEVDDPWAMSSDEEDKNIPPPRSVPIEKPAATKKSSRKPSAKQKPSIPEITMSHEQEEERGKVLKDHSSASDDDDNDALLTARMTARLEFQQQQQSNFQEAVSTHRSSWGEEEEAIARELRRTGELDDVGKHDRGLTREEQRQRRKSSEKKKKSGSSTSRGGDELTADTPRRKKKSSSSGKTPRERTSSSTAETPRSSRSRTESSTGGERRKKSSSDKPRKTPREGRDRGISESKKSARGDGETPRRKRDSETPRRRNENETDAERAERRRRRREAKRAEAARAATPR